jgi:hypothetical protein
MTSMDGTFLGSAKGSVNHETLELTRLVRRDNANLAILMRLL